MVNRPVDSSIRSRHTGQVGSSIKAGVGGACGLDEREFVTIGDAWRLALGVPAFVTEGVKGSFVMSGKDDSCPGRSWVRNSMDLTNTT